ncbi:MAG: lipoyl(octanoyl) transferase LipB [Armatimonadota bacterium]
MSPLDVRRLGRCDYQQTVTLQEDLVRRRRAGEIGDTLLLLEHDPVITVGRGRGIFPVASATIPIVETSRGGQATYHGPGQLVVYPILDLRQWQCDLHWYLRQLEQVIIDAVANLNLSPERVEGYTGVWLGGNKIASIGVAVRGWITYHGVALNVDCDMSGFSAITPCGLPADVMSSLSAQGAKVTVDDAMRLVEDAFRRTFGFL